MIEVHSSYESTIFTNYLQKNWLFLYSFYQVSHLFSLQIMYYIVSFLISAGAIFAISNYHIIEGISLMNGYVSALIFAVVLALVNIILGTILRIITFPLRLITLGLFSFVISLLLIYVTDQLVPGVTLTGWIPLLAIAVVTTVVSFLMKMFK